MGYFDFTGKVGYRTGKEFSFSYYDAERVILGKKMKEHLPFAMAWWHNLCAAGTDMFGRDTADKSFKQKSATMAHAKAKVDTGFEIGRASCRERV